MIMPLKKFICIIMSFKIKQHNNITRVTSWCESAYRCLKEMHFIEFMTFNLESEFLSLFVHGFRWAESRDDSVVVILALRQQPWVAIYCKVPPNRDPLDKTATRDYAEDMEKVKECLQGKHGFESQELCEWGRVPPTDVDRFVSGKIWGIGRVGDTSDVHKVEEQWLNALLFNESQAKYLEITGLLATDTLRFAPQYQNRGMGVTKTLYIDVTMDFSWRTVVYSTHCMKNDSTQ